MNAGEQVTNVITEFELNGTVSVPLYRKHVSGSTHKLRAKGHFIKTPNSKLSLRASLQK